MNTLYLDTNVISNLRNSTSEYAEKLYDVITKKSALYELYYSAAHLEDFNRDVTTDKKDIDLKYMSTLGMSDYLVYRHRDRKACLINIAPIDAFYNMKVSQEQHEREFKNIKKPRIDKMSVEVYDWFKGALANFEGDEMAIESLDPKSKETFFKILAIVDLPSDKLTFEAFNSKVDQHWEDEVYKMNDKEATKYLLNTIDTNRDLLSYKNEKFDLTEPNLKNQMKDSEFKKNYSLYIQGILYNMGLDFKNNFDELSLFTSTYGMLQIMGVEYEKAKGFNIRSSVNDAHHCYFASTCDFLITEDKGFYKKIKVSYEILGTPTKVYTIKEFIEAYHS
ncbi:hypothetical protein BH09BAC4_BH09BAC4_44880 [soil metagenome]